MSDNLVCAFSWHEVTYHEWRLADHDGRVIGWVSAGGGTAQGALNGQAPQEYLTVTQAQAAVMKAALRAAQEAPNA